MVQDVSEVQRSLDWLVTDFTERVADVAHAVVVSSGGVPVAVSNDTPAGQAEQLCAITCGLAGLTDGAARLSGGGMVIQALIEMERGLMAVKAVSGGASLAVLAAPESDRDLVAYEMTLLAEAAGDLLTPPGPGTGLRAGDRAEGQVRRFRATSPRWPSRSVRF